MNTTAFLSNYIPNLTDSMSPETQTQVVSQLCRKDIPLKSVMSTYWNLNATFYLPIQAQYKMIDCINQRSNGSAVEYFLNTNISPSRVFYWDPFTPKGFLWFASQSEATQATAIYAICLDSRFNVQFFKNTFTYFNASIAFSEKVQSGMSLCIETQMFLKEPITLESRKWFVSQSKDVQRTAVTRLCSSPIYNRNSLFDIFKYLGDALFQVQSEAQACLLTYKLEPAEIGFEYHLASTQVLVWLASQDVTDQNNFVRNVCFGYFKKAPHHYYTLVELLQILQTYSEYLMSTTGLLRVVQNQIQSCGPFYQQVTVSSVYEKHLWSPISRTWLQAQNSTVQGVFVERLCNDRNINSTVTTSLFNILDLSDSYVRKIMLDCTKTQDIIGDFVLNIQILIGTASVSAIGLLGLFILIYFEVTILDTPQTSILKRICTKFNFLLAACFASTGIDAALFGSFLWFKVLNQVTGMAEAVKMADISIIGSDLFHTLWCVCYLSFCWTRSESILMNVWPRTYWLIWILFPLSGLILFGPLISDVVVITFKDVVLERIGSRSMNRILFILESIAACMLFSVDALLLFTFTRLLINYAVGVICIIYSGAGIAKPMLTWKAYKLKLLMSVSSLIVNIILLSMKLSLFYDSKKSENITASKLQGISDSEVSGPIHVSNQSQNYRSTAVIFETKETIKSSQFKKSGGGV
ncbi:hypothetical protein BCR33DRAFT_721899 [Rhizoclosmatium globosum]|uniref:Uncharacterized protein n=1 Tax=Rhizoclosmatium globosum TaxID=329046 RepID=A0A1Y2BPZ7_9FUNG|nr:hypothetical protein BCR33DRAFT_721899 [Rhizoclosmatium globosum]|eukprot:ORY36687.1 hypothetical protein BCR33DRAFT_721899 [Rhizoclosmatium globosum]